MNIELTVQAFFSTQRMEQSCGRLMERTISIEFDSTQERTNKLARVNSPPVKKMCLNAMIKESDSKFKSKGTVCNSINDQNYHRYQGVTVKV